MLQTKLVARLNQIATRALPAATGMYRALGIIFGVLGLGMLAIALYLVPRPATLVLVLLGLGLPMMLMLWHRPELGLLALIFLISSLIPEDIVDLRLPIGGGLELRDLVLIGMLGLLILRGLSHNSLSIPWWHVGTPLLVFLACALFSALYALFYQQVESNWALSDLRTLTFYCVFFLTGWTITNSRQLTTVLVSLFIVADLIAGVLILQQFLGPNHLLFTAMSYSNWRVYDMGQTSSAANFGMVRIMPPSIALAYFMMIVAFCLMVFTPHKRHLQAIYALEFVFLSFGLLLTYTRALWIAAATALGLILIAIFPTYKARLTPYLVIGIVALLVLFGVLGMDRSNSITNSALVNASAERFISIFTPEETMKSLSLQWRVFETEEGLRSVSEHPLLGVGLGNSYREITTLSGENKGWLTRRSLATGVISRFTRFLHNSYLSIAVKMGLPALACFLWFCAALVVGSWQLYRNLSDGQPRAIALAVSAGFVGLMFWSFFHQHFIQTEGTAVVGLMAGLTASIQAIYGAAPISRSGHGDLP
jgi:O-antigen ligase